MMTILDTGLNWFGVKDGSLLVGFLLLLSLCGEALAGSSCQGDVDGEMPRDNGKFFGKHI